LFNHIKNIMKTSLYITIGIVAFIMASCAPDKTDDPNAPAPSTDSRDKFVAYWNVNENSATAGTNTHTVNITKSTSAFGEVIINNFSGLSASARASVNNHQLIIPYQQIGSIGFAQGSGTLTNANTISLSYTTTISSNRDSCTAIYTKQ
jgi:hypothetical protein